MSPLVLLCCSYSVIRHYTGNFYFFNVGSKDDKCITPYGVALGKDSTGTVGYSNCNDLVTS